MKTINKILIVILTLILSLNISHANESKYKLDIANINYTSEKSLEFDIYLMSTNVDKEDLKYSIGQYFFEFNPKIANGGVLSYSIVSSDLPEAMRPRNASVSENLLRLACNSVSSSKENLPFISKAAPGLLIVKMKLETSADKFSAEPLNLNWADNSKLLKTKIFVFDGKNNIDITNSGDITIDGVTGNKSNENITSLPTEYALAQNYPNPFNPVTKINYDLPVSGQVTLKIYDMLGKEVATLVNEKMDAGRYSATFNGANLASGMYFYKITAGTYTAMKKMVLIK